MAAARLMKDWPLYLLYRAFSGLFGLLPEPLMRRFGEGMGRLAWRVAGGRRQLVERHLRRATGQDDVAELSKAMFASYGRYWAEVFWIRPRRKEQIVAGCTIEGEEHIHEAKAAGKGIVLALPHMGNWESAGAKAEAIGIPVLAAAEGLSNKKIVDWFVDVRRDLGIETVITGRGNRVMVALARRLKEGGAIALVSDRDVSGRGVAVEFFGERTTMPPGPVALAERSGAALLPVACYFESGEGHRFVVRPPLEIPPAESREERVASGTQAFAAVLEELIRQAPQDWHLFVPNWPSDKEAAS
ncbi:MAG: phosphatidylinositol mannoside acyltransferase [bacterium]|nr:phosphatidylinositol mannoside acyltransferase [bacterium]